MCSDDCAKRSNDYGPADAGIRDPKKRNADSIAHKKQRKDFSKVSVTLFSFEGAINTSYAVGNVLRSYQGY